MNAAFFHRNADHLAEKRLRDEARFRMVTRGRGQRTAVATDKMFAFAFLKAGRAAEVRQDAESGVDSLLPGLSFHFSQVFVCHLSTDLPHSTLQFPRRQFSGEDRQD